MRLVHGVEGIVLGASGRVANDGSGETEGRIGVVWTS